VPASGFWAVLDTEGLWQIVGLSLGVSLTATSLATLAGTSLGAALALCSFPGRRPLVILTNAFLGLPPVVVGLALYLLLSRSGPLGVTGLLFTPIAMMLAQFILATPIVTALAHRAVATAWTQYGGALMVDGASRLRAVPHLLAIERIQILVAVLAGFGRTVSEVGAILIVGGNIAGYTRTMTTTIVLETSKGNLPLALGLGFVLIGVSIAVSAAIFGLGMRGGRGW
jgi:tungstate transport system permease protein